MITQDKVEGFLIGLGAGVLLAAFMELREAPAESPTDRQQDTADAFQATSDANTVAAGA